MSERGKIINEDRARQLRDFTGLLWAGTITPSDIDGFIPYGFQGLVEFRNELFVFFELKYKDTNINDGQKKAYARVCDAIKDLPCYFLIARHEIEDPSKNIIVANCEVIEFRYKKEWRKPQNKWTVKEFINKALEKHHVVFY